jgi:hypothetical protein
MISGNGVEGSLVCFGNVAMAASGNTAWGESPGSVQLAIKRPAGRAWWLRPTAQFVLTAMPVAAALSTGVTAARASPSHLPATASASAAAPVLGSSPIPHTANVSLSQVQSAVHTLYRAHPDIGSFVVQDVQYTTESLKAAFKACTGVQGLTVSQANQTGQLLACAPLIFFLYRYGQDKSVPAALQVANELYSYVITHTTGPSNSETVLGGVLHSWGLPVSGNPVASGPVNSPGETSLVDGTNRAILAQGSVHLSVLGYQGNSKRASEKIVADVGPGWARESLMAGKATASVTVTPNAAYFSGNNAGLRSLIGLNAAAAKKAGRHWVTMKKGTSEYKDFVTEETIESVPATVLPTSSSSVKLSNSVSGGRPVKVLTWDATVSGSSTPLTETLVLSGTTPPLPVTELTRAGGDREVATFSGWGEKITVADPPASSAIPYSSLT